MRSNSHGSFEQLLPRAPPPPWQMREAYFPEAKQLGRYLVRMSSFFFSNGLLGGLPDASGIMSDFPHWSSVW